MNATERAALIDRYAAGPALLRATLAKVPADAMKWRPAPGKWSAHEVAVHCTDAETNAVGRLRYVLVEKEPLIVGYDQDAWARDLDYHSQPLDLALAVIDAVRANTAHLLRRLPPEAFAKTGRHTEFGAYSAEKWLTYYAEHLHVHSAQIERNLAAFASQRR